MTELERELGYEFQNPALLENALTHSSYANENRGRSCESNWSSWATACSASWWPTRCITASRNSRRAA